MTKILQSLIGQTVEDVVLCGIVDTDDDPADFTPILDRIYLLIGESTMQIERDEASVRLSVRLVANIETPTELDDGQAGCRSSVGKYVFVNPLADNRISNIIVYDDDNGMYRALEILLESGQLIFFDPSFFDGINFGGADQKAIWLDNTATYDAITIS